MLNVSSRTSMPLYGLSVLCPGSRPVDDDVVSSKRKENTHRKHCEIGDYRVFVSGCVKLKGTSRAVLVQRIGHCGIV